MILKLINFSEAARKGIKFITQLCNAVFKRGFFSLHWKIAEIIMIQKPGKPAKLAESYMLISLLLVVETIRNLLLPRLCVLMER